MKIEALNRLPEAQARVAFDRCCGSSRWITAMVAARPFPDRAALETMADRAFARLGLADWLEAFSKHPKIGDVAEMRSRFANTAAWAGTEQGGVASADEATLKALADDNRTYEQRFGYIFIVCATGKGAEEMLAMLRARLGNDPEREFELAAAEQRKITWLRIGKLLAEGNYP